MTKLLTCFLKSSLTKEKKKYRIGRRLKQLVSNENLIKHKGDMVILEINNFVCHHRIQNVEKLKKVLIGVPYFQ